VLAVVDNKPITSADLKPFLPPNFESFVPDQALAVQRAALENAIINVILSAEARRRRISVPALRMQMTFGPVRITNEQVEEEFKKNMRYFGLLSPHEAKERLRFHLRVDEHLKYYRAALAKLRARAKIDVRLVPPQIVRPIGTGPSDGPGSARVTITMFSDFQCRYCRDSQPILAQVLNEYPEDVRLVFRHLPLAGIRAGMSPATAAVCADEQGSFWEYHDAAYASQSLTITRLRQIADELKLDIARFEKCISSTTPENILSADIAEAQRLGIPGTPAFIINGRLYKGKLEFWQFKELIESELAFSAKTHGY
jgi:protein-disulfide isomerase